MKNIHTFEYFTMSLRIISMTNQCMILYKLDKKQLTKTDNIGKLWRFYLMVN